MDTKTVRLAKIIQDIYEQNKIKIDALPIKGPLGGHNAKFIEGWKNLGNGTITKSVNMTSLPTLNYWSGSNPTPSTAIPKCVYDKIKAAYDKVFNK
jgi:hypothetical protein